MGKYPAWQNGKYGICESTFEKTEFIPYGRDFDITEISFNLDTEEFFLTLEFDYMGMTKQITVSKEEASDVKKIITYAGKGLDVNSSSVKVAVEVIQAKEEVYNDNNGNLAYIHQKLGWKDIEDEDGVSRLFFGKDGNSTIASAYNPENFDVAPKGELEDWVEFVNSLAGDVRIQFVLSVSFGAILRGYLEGKCPVENFLVGLIGGSSSGKSTMLALMVSVFGNPLIGAQTLTTTFNSTMNALQKRLLYANGYLFGLDELSLAGKNIDIDSTIYAIASGVEKGSLTKERELNPCGQNAYLVCYTGEHSIFERSNQNGGLYVRVLEFMINSWTKSAEESELIKEFTSKNYGTAAIAFADALVDYTAEHGEQSLVETYEVCRKQYADKSVREFAKERVSSRYGLILMGTIFAKQFLNLNFDVDKVCDFIIDYEKTADEEVINRYRASYDSLISWVFRNKQHFVRGSDSTKAYKEIYGKISAKRTAETVEGKPTGKEFMEGEVAIIKDCFKKICVEELGFESPNVIINWMKSNNYLDYEAGRLTRKRTVDGMVQTVYAIKFKVEIIQDENKSSILELVRLLEDEEKEEAEKHEKEKTKQEEARAKQEMAKARQEEARAIQKLRSLTELLGEEDDDDSE